MCLCMHVLYFCYLRVISAMILYFFDHHFMHMLQVFLLNFCIKVCKQQANGCTQFFDLYSCLKFAKKIYAKNNVGTFSSIGAVSMVCAFSRVWWVCAFSRVWWVRAFSRVWWMSAFSGVWWVCSFSGVWWVSAFGRVWWVCASSGVW